MTTKRGVGGGGAEGVSAYSVSPGMDQVVIGWMVRRVPIDQGIPGDTTNRGVGGGGGWW